MSSANNAFNLKGAISKAAGTAAGMLIPGYSAVAPLVKSALTPKASTPASTSAPITQGTNPGILSSNTGQKSAADPATLTLQKQLNQKNQGQPGWVSLSEDGILGPKTKAAMDFKPTPVQQPQMQQQQQPAPQPQPQVQQPPQQQYQTYPGLISQLSGAATTASPEVTNAQGLLDQALKSQQELESGIARTYGNIESQAIPLEFQQGREQALARQYASQQSAAQSRVTGATTGLNTALTGQGQRLGALGTAAGLLAPIQAPYSNQVLQYGANGQLAPLQNTGGNLPDVVSGIVQKVTSGNMTYNDALGALQGYGQAGINALNQALPKDFNVAQSNTLSGQQGSVKVNYDLADTALKNVENAIADLGKLQKTNVPIFNQFTNWASLQSGLGSEKTRGFIGAVQSLRNAYATLLASAKGGTPTDYSSQATAEIPDMPTPNDIAAIRHNFETLGQARVNIYGNPGLQGSNDQSSGGSIWNF